MIFVERKKPFPKSVTDALDRLDDDRRTELDVARDYYKKKAPSARAYEFERYKARPVRVELERLFHKKCAYCETAYGASDAWQVEHFRPKGRVAGAPLHPGYWWLAGSFENLFPSCIGCNQRKRRVEYLPGMTLADVERLAQAQVGPTTLLGKGSNFPVAGPRVMTECQALSNEDPLLIDPCERDPTKHLEWVFDHDGQHPLWEAMPVLPFLRPRQTAGVEDAYGLNSMMYYGLNRLGVFRDRLEHLNEVQRRCQPFAQTFMVLVAEPEADSEHYRQLEADHRRAYEVLAKDLNADSEYAGMKRAFIEQVKAELVLEARAVSE